MACHWAATTEPFRLPRPLPGCDHPVTRRAHRLQPYGPKESRAAFHPNSTIERSCRVRYSHPKPKRVFCHPATRRDCRSNPDGRTERLTEPPRWRKQWLGWALAPVTLESVVAGRWEERLVAAET